MDRSKPHNSQVEAESELLFLGTGTSHGVPMIGCDCPVCQSHNPKNKRLRSSVFITIKSTDTRILVDTSVDFRQQMLRHHIRRIDAIFFTHHHADHIFGLDDVRTFSDRQGRVDCYVPEFAEERIRGVFGYAFAAPDTADCGGLPRLNLTAINAPFFVNGHTVTPVELPHGPYINVFGYRIGSLAYLTDCSTIPDEALPLLRDLDVVVLDALRPKPHPTHMSIEQAVAAAEKIGANRTFFTHISHRSDHETLAASLPEHIQPAYDGLSVEVYPV